MLEFRVAAHVITHQKVHERNRDHRTDVESNRDNVVRISIHDECRRHGHQNDSEKPHEVEENQKSVELVDEAEEAVMFQPEVRDDCETQCEHNEFRHDTFEEGIGVSISELRRGVDHGKDQKRRSNRDNGIGEIDDPVVTLVFCNAQGSSSPSSR